MCLIIFAYQAHPKYKLILTANRDEFYERPTASAGFWEEAPDILAGRDLLLGGTWLGITKTGRVAAVTNYRDPHQQSGAISRGGLVSDFLRGQLSVIEYLQQVKKEADNYIGFNLLVGDFSRKKDELAYFSNRSDEIKILDSGLYGLSNALLETPWPKVARGKTGLTKLLESNDEISPDKLLDLLQDRSMAKDEDLPETGVSLEYERILSPCFIETPIYGTRSTSVVIIGKDNSVSFTEKSFHPPLDKMTKTFQIS